MSSCPETSLATTEIGSGEFTSHARTESLPAGLGISDQLLKNPLLDDEPERHSSSCPSEPDLEVTETEGHSQAVVSMANLPILAPYTGTSLQYPSNIQLTDVFTVAQTENTGPESILDSFDQTYAASDQPVNIESSSTSSLLTISESQADTKPHDSPTKSDLVSFSAYGSTQSSPSPSLSTSTRSGLLRQKPSGFFWQLDSHGFPCSAVDCNRRCNLWDGRSVICPRCGPFSEIRYCSRDHLLKDVETHWAFCGQQAFTHPCHESSIPGDVRAGPPLVPCLLQCDTPERHRQAVYFNVCEDMGDYFIFADLFEPDLDKRCSSRVFTPVVFDDPAEKDKFRRILAACLFCTFPLSTVSITFSGLLTKAVTVEVVDLVDYMYRLIRDNLRSKALWRNDLDSALKHQLARELSVHIQSYISGTRHACSTEWEGCSRRACHDAVCRGEYRRILGQLGGTGHRRLVEFLESGNWVLRAVRTTHPVAKRVEERMMGVGFEGVVEEDQRKFSWGAGWDGAGSAGLEIESV